MPSGGNAHPSVARMYTDDIRSYEAAFVRSETLPDVTMSSELI